MSIFFSYFLSLIFVECFFLFTPANKSKVYYGIPPEPDLGVVIEEENEDDDDKDKPKVNTWSSKPFNKHFKTTVTGPLLYL